MSGVFSTWKRAKQERGKGLTKRYYFIHFILKYRLLVPLLKLTDRYLSKHLDHEVPDKPEYAYLQALSDAVEESFTEWTHWMAYDYNERRAKAGRFKQWRTKNKTAEDFKHIATGQSTRYVRLMKDLLLTVCVSDTAYNPLFMIISNKYHEKLQERKTWDSSKT